MVESFTNVVQVLRGKIMSIAEFNEKELTEKCGNQFSLKDRLPAYDYLDSVKTYSLKAYSDSSENSTFSWSLSNPYLNGYFEVHDQPVSINNPEVRLKPSSDTKSCDVTIDSCNIFRTSSLITVYVWNTDNSAGENNMETASCLRQSAKVSVSEMYIFKK